MRALGIALSASALMCGACGGGHDESPPAPQNDCTGPVRTKGTLVPDALTIGTGSPQRFSPSMDGDATELIVGSQGGYMAVPLFQVDAAAMGTDGVCAYLDVQAAVDGQDPEDYVIRLPDSSPSERYWYFGTLPLFLSYDEGTVLDRDCTYTAAFIDDEREADAEVTLHLVDNE